MIKTMIDTKQKRQIIFNNLVIGYIKNKFHTLMTASVSLSSALFRRLRISRSRPRSAAASANGAFSRAGGEEMNDVKDTAPVVGNT
jgi:hypothetical protein